MVMSPKRFEELKEIRLSSLNEFVSMLTKAPGSLKTGLTGEELAKEIIKGARFIQKFIEYGEVDFPPSASDQ
jgi:hypothetical protein